MASPPEVQTARHCIKYVKWERVKRWRQRIRADGLRIEEAYPYAFASRDPAFLNLGGNVLWLVTLPQYGDFRQAPSLVAKLEVEDAYRFEEAPDQSSELDPEVRMSGNFIVKGNPDRSTYFPLNNAFHTLLRLQFDTRAPSLAASYANRDRSRERTRGPYFTLAGHFQKHRWLTDDSVPELERYAAAVQRGRRVFLSYKRTDFPELQRGPSWPERLANELMAKDVSCWWDRWNLPQADEDESQALEEDLLKGLLEDAVQQAAWFVALIGPRYLSAGNDSWPRREWFKAGTELGDDGRRHEMHRIAVFLSAPRHDAEHQRWVGPDDHVIWAGADADPATVAKAIASELG
jgi:hypothetical protein